MAPRMVTQLAFINLVFLISFSVQASSPDYYTVEETEAQKFNHSIHSDSTEGFFSLNPMNAMSEVVRDSAAKVLDFSLSLMNWVHHNEELEDPDVPYNRKNHYGTWVRDRRENNCYNTRARVLIRDSQIPVTFNDKGCTVLSGQWYDPYSNQEYTQASDIQIDHVVPLKNSYVSGGWKWDSSTRCLYA
ncbi:MAG TPA: hypothetical protein VIG33_08485, partial [Pseudobdellovibrionaceae bacterium]